jgi:hypothetical protein
MKFVLAAWLDPASVAVPLEGRGHFSPPRGVARGPRTEVLWSEGTRVWIKLVAFTKVNMLAQVAEQIPLGSILVMTSAVRSRKG